MSVIIDGEIACHYCGDKLMMEVPLVENKSGIFSDRNGHRFKLENGVRVPLNHPSPKADVPKKQDHRSEEPASHAEQVKQPEKPVKSRSLISFLKGSAKVVKSSYIKAGKYDSTNSILRLEFHNMPEVWHPYENVTPEEAEAFFSAPSKGKWFHDNIKGRGSKKGEHLKNYLGAEKEKEVQDA